MDTAQETINKTAEHHPAETSDLKCTGATGDHKYTEGSWHLIKGLDVVGCKSHEDFGLITEDEFAEAMNVSKLTAAKWRKDGEGPAYTMVGKSIYYQTKNIYSWLDWRTFFSGKEPHEHGARTISA